MRNNAIAKQSICLSDVKNMLRFFFPLMIFLQEQFVVNNNSLEYKAIKKNRLIMDNYWFYMPWHQNPYFMPKIDFDGDHFRFQQNAFFDNGQFFYIPFNYQQSNNQNVRVVEQKEKKNPNNHNNQQLIDVEQMGNVDQQCKDQLQTGSKQRKKKTEIEKIKQTDWDRNISSNVLKKFFRYIHEDLQKTDSTFQKIMKISLVKCSKQQFLEWLSSSINIQLNYIRLNWVKQLCMNEDKTNNRWVYARVFRIYLKIFLRTTIFMLNCKIHKGRRPIRKQHLKICRKFFTQFFGIS